MNNPTLDKIAAEIGFNLVDDEIKKEKEDKKKNKAKELANTINKALGILIEDGLFAYAIWLESEDETGTIDKSFELLNKINLIKGNYGNGKDKLRRAILKEISTSIEKTLLARQLLERMLVYARYRAKALQG